MDVYYEQTFDLLLEKIVELQRALKKYKSNNGENETFKFYDSVSKVMKLAWNTFLDFKQMYYEVESIKMENEYLKDRNRMLRMELANYKTVERLKLTDELDAISAHVDLIIERKEKIKQLHEEGAKNVRS